MGLALFNYDFKYEQRLQVKIWQIDDIFNC